MTPLRRVHRYMTERRGVLLDDGRLGRIVRVDTEFPRGSTTVSVWTETPRGPGVAKVDITRIVGEAKKARSA